MHYYHCKSCEYIFKSPEYFCDLQAQKERYDLHKNNEDDAGYIAYFQRFINFVLSHVSNVHTAFDFGCGCTSLLAQLLKKEGIICDYYDPLYHPHMPDKTKKYDLVVSTEVFEHLHQPKEVFEQLLKRLNSGGYLAVQTEFHSNEQRSFQAWWYPHDATHVVFFRAETFRVLCKMYGCSYVADNAKNMVIIRKL